jgi:hypothetical protein
MPQSQSRHDLNKLGLKNPPYFLLFLLSISFIAVSLLAYNYTSNRVSRELALKGIKEIYVTPTVTPTTVQTDTDLVPIDNNSSQSAQITQTDQITPTVIPSPTPPQPYSKSFTSTDFNFKIDYMSTRQLFQDSSSVMNRFVFVNPEGNFVIHVGTKDYDWTHSNRTFTNTPTLAGKQTFVFDTTSQKVIDLKTDNGFFYTLQCVHNGSDELVSECQDFVQSFSFIDQF